MGISIPPAMSRIISGFEPVLSNQPERVEGGWKELERPADTQDCCPRDTCLAQWRSQDFSWGGAKFFSSR